MKGFLHFLLFPLIFFSTTHANALLTEGNVNSEHKEYVTNMGNFFSLERRQIQTSNFDFNPIGPWRLQVRNKNFEVQNILLYKKEFSISAPGILRLAHEGDQKPPLLSKFNQIQFDYSSRMGEALCLPKITIKGGASEGGNKKSLYELTASIFRIDQLEPISTASSAGNGWKPKTFDYYVGRFYGSQDESSWYYKHKNGEGFWQRRLHVPLNNIEALDIEIKKNTIINHVNIKVSNADNYRQGDLVEFPAFKGVILPNGNPGIRLNIQEALKNRFPTEWTENKKQLANHKFFIQEIIISVSEQSTHNQLDRPVKDLTFLGWANRRQCSDTNPSICAIQVPISVVEIDAFRRVMIVDVRNLAKEDPFFLENLELTLAPPEGSSSCSIQIERFRLIKTEVLNINPVIKGILPYSLLGILLIILIFFKKIIFRPPSFRLVGRHFLMYCRKQFSLIILCLLTFSLYLAGVMNLAGTSKNYFFLFGEFMATFTLRFASTHIYGYLCKRYSFMNTYGFKNISSQYFSGAPTALLLTMLSLCLGLNIIAEEFGIIAFYCLLIGVFKAAVSILRKQSVD